MLARLASALIALTSACGAAQANCADEISRLMSKDTERMLSQYNSVTRRIEREGSNPSLRAEECRIAIRNVRRTGMDDLKKAEKDKKISEDQLKGGETKIQAMTDRFIKKVDEVADKKSKEVLEI